MDRFPWQPPDPRRFEVGRWADHVRLVRPYVFPVHPERPPADAPALAVADCCPAAPTTVLWRVRLDSIAEGWDLYSAAIGAQVAELQLCGHHADVHEPAAHEQGWVAVIDMRQHLRDVARQLA